MPGIVLEFVNTEVDKTQQSELMKLSPLKGKDYKS